MTPEQFVDRAVGVPWVRWRSDWAGCDCFGLILLYHREVYGLDLGAVPRLDMADGFVRASDWRLTDDQPTIWVSFSGESATHCGILLPWGGALHSEGSVEHPGNVRMTPLRTIRRMYGTIKTLRHADHH